MNRQSAASEALDVRLGGLLGDALQANLRGRLSHFIVDEHSPAIALFDPELRQHNRAGDWYGEHAGKWLYASAKAADRSGDEAFRAQVLRVADYLVSTQEPDGYLGTYAVDRRFMQPQPPKPASWDGAPSVRTWDVWTHAYLILGLLEVHRHFHTARHLDAARRIGELCWYTLTEGGIDITALGNHHGMSATVLMDPAVELYFATGDTRFINLARLVLDQADRNRDLALLTRALAGVDAAAIGTGKAYQLIWNLVGVAKLHKATGDPRYREAVDHIWQNIREHHLSLGGGPWGGVALRSREVFNPAGVFSPQGYVETCSTLAWIQLNRELLAITGAARYADEIERSAYNDLLGAQAPDGENWCYYVFPNGRRVTTTYWRCCKSSGAIAFEELPGIAYTRDQAGSVTVQIYGPSEARFALADSTAVRIVQDTRYPYAGDIHLTIYTDQPARFALRLRIPEWARGATLAIDGMRADIELIPGDYAVIDRIWQRGTQLRLDLPMRPILHRVVNCNVQESLAPDGSEVKQQVLRYEYAGITCGPLAYATGLIDGFKTEETVRLPDAPAQAWLTRLPDSDDGLPRIALDPGYRAPLVFTPYFATGGRVDGAWRISWVSLAPESP